MPVYIVTGKLGSGKSISMVGKARDYLLEGRVVATNIDLRLEKLLPVTARKARCYRVPDKPSLRDLEAIGSGNESYDESRNGALILDECGTWLNSRGWQDPERKPVLDWFLHARKLGWDLYLIVQDISLIDKQAREALAEHVVWCRRADRLPIPGITALFSLIGLKVRMPRIHWALVKYGDTKAHVTVERWVYRGMGLYAGYDTKQVFRDTGDGVATLLPPWYTVGRYRRVIPWQRVAWVAARFLLLPLVLVVVVATGKLKRGDLAACCEGLLAEVRP